jgi:GNAT superfamily N-acetyltransferase
MHIHIHNKQDGIDGLLAFCRDMMEASYCPAYSREVLAFFLEYHNAASIARDLADGRIWLAQEHGRPVGTVTVAAGELSRMFVEPSMRGRGVGRALAAEALGWARETGLGKLTAWSVPFSRGFYEKLGFVAVNADTLNFTGTREPPVPYIEMALWPQGAPEAAISPAGAPDAEELLAAQREAFAEQCRIYDDWDIPPMKETAREFSEFLWGGGVALKAEIGGRIVGSARGKELDGTCHVGRLFVTPEWQGRSVARRLLAALEEAFPGCASFELYTGERSEKNLALYARQGYAPTGRRAPAKKPGSAGNYDLIWLQKPNPWPEIIECARRYREA